MQHVIKNVISQEQIDMLRSFKGARSLNLYTDEVGEFVLNFVIESPDRKISVKNIPINASDGDEYPKLKIEHTTTPNLDCKLVYVGTDLKDIFILKDVASWQNNGFNWKIEVDIGLKLIFQKEEFLLVAQDSLAGFLNLFTLNKMTPVKEILDDYWSMKTDKVDSLIREEMKI